MNRRERVQAALRGEPVDRVPISFWAHNFATENSAEGLASETLRVFEQFDWDYLKPQSRAQCFAEMWGFSYEPSGRREEPYRATHAPVSSAAQLAALTPKRVSEGALGEQLSALSSIRAAVGPDAPIIWTVFAPLMVMPYLLMGGRAQLRELIHDDVKAVHAGLAAIAETLADYAGAAIEAGADGLFYATNVATNDLLDPALCREVQRPYDLPILEAARGGWFNMLHICGSEVLFDEFVDYPVDCFSWAAERANPTLSVGQRRTGRTVVGGLPAKPSIVSLQPADMVRRLQEAVDEMKGRRLLLGPHCSINPDTPDALLFAARDAARDISSAL